MRGFEDFLVESLKCKDIAKLFYFSGSVEENCDAVEHLWDIYANGSCEEKLLTVCCIWDFVIHNFCKSNNYTVIDPASKAQMCTMLKGYTKSLLASLSLDSCGSPDCFGKHAVEL